MRHDKLSLTVSTTVLPCLLEPCLGSLAKAHADRRLERPLSPDWPASKMMRLLCHGFHHNESTATDRANRNNVVREKGYECTRMPDVSGDSTEQPIRGSAGVFACTAWLAVTITPCVGLVSTRDHLVALGLSQSVEAAVDLHPQVRSAPAFSQRSQEVSAASSIVLQGYCDRLRATCLLGLSGLCC